VILNVRERRASMEKGGETTEAPRQQISDLSKLLVFFSFTG
jgi:hypothetical protein